MRYFDASAITKRYVRERGSVRVRRLLFSDAAATSRLSQVEIVSALMRRSRERALSDAKRESALAMLDDDLSAMLVVELSPAVTERASRLLRRHVLRAGDAIQLASALHLRDELQEEIGFIVFDERLAAAAAAEGLAPA
jgi:predicted nucleic acid-binding protein